MREEDQVIFQDNMKAKIGGTEYEIPLLKLDKSRLWKQEWDRVVFGAEKWKEAVSRIDKLQKEKAGNEELQVALSISFHELLVGQPEEVIKLVCYYLKLANFDKDETWIYENANEAEIAILWDEINEVSFPLVTSLANTRIKMGKSR